MEKRDFATPVLYMRAADGVILDLSKRSHIVPESKTTPELSPTDLLKYLEEDKFYEKDSHFKLSSGKHSDTYIQARIAMMLPQTCHVFATELASKLSKFGPTMLASSTIGGILLAKETASILKVPLLVGRQNAGSFDWVCWGLPSRQRIDIENCDLASLRRIVFVDDIYMTGRSLRSSIHDLLQKKPGAKIVAAAVAVDRRGENESQNEVKVDGVTYYLSSLIPLQLNEWDPGNCPICPKPYISRYNAEQDIISAISSMPQKDKMIIDGFRNAYSLQDDQEQIKMIDRLAPWIESLKAGLPMVRVSEDSDLALFIRQLYRDEREDRKRVLSELVGHLLRVSNIRVDGRSLGCSILIGEEEDLERLEIKATKVPIEVPKNIKSGSFDKLIPYYDALQENEAVFLFNRDGELFGIRHLGEYGETRGIQSLRKATNDSDTIIGLVLRRNRRSIAVYRKGKLEAVAELSEKTGIWEFTTPVRVVEEIIGLLPSIDQALLENVLEVSMEMVNKGYEGLFIIGDISPKLKRDARTINVKPVSLAYLGVGMALDIAKLGGAMIISKDGYVRAASVIISDEGDNARSLYESIGRVTALKVSTESPDTAVVCVSKNGAIEIFVNGKSFPVSESIAG